MSELKKGQTILMWGKWPNPKWRWYKPWVSKFVEGQRSFEITHVEIGLPHV